MHLQVTKVSSWDFAVPAHNVHAPPPPPIRTSSDSPLPPQKKKKKKERGKTKTTGAVIMSETYDTTCTPKTRKKG